MNIEILGEEYEIIEDEKLDGADGCCDKTTKIIKICKTLSEQSDDPMALKNIKWQADKVKRHEVIHAIMFESGLAECHTRIHNEEVVDWFAAMYPKMKKIFDKLGI